MQESALVMLFQKVVGLQDWWKSLMLEEQMTKLPLTRFTVALLFLVLIFETLDRRNTRILME